MVDLLEGFDTQVVELADVTIQVRTGGRGAPIQLLHGYPQSMVMWHRVAPRLAEQYTVVLADLRGYGASGKPASDPSHQAYSKRAMSGDLLAVMTHLGHDRFAVVGHDRGGRVAHRMALDAAERVSAVAMLDIVPTRHMFCHVDRAMASTYFHWFFLALDTDVAERLVNADPAAWVRSRFARRHAGGLPIDDSAMAEYVRHFRDPRTVHATCADYRAAASIDLVHDETDFAAGVRVRQPPLALWGSESYVGRTFDVTSVWRDYADSVTGHAVEADHYLAEEAPDQTVAALKEFLCGVDR